MKNIYPTNLNNIEKLAAIQHEIWSHWMKYLFNVCKQNDDGTYTIPYDKVAQWKRQINTQYEDLSEQEKDSDREQATKIFSILDKLTTLRR